MKAGDKIRIIKGEHEGKKGEAIAEWIAKGIGTLENRDFRGWWFVEFEDGSQDVIQEPLMEVIEFE